MKFTKILEGISQLGDSVQDKQRSISALEVGHIWDKLVARYDIIEFTNILNGFVKDPDLKMLMVGGIKVLDRHVKDLEKLATKYGIPLPQKPPAGFVSTTNIEALTDRYIFRRVFTGVQSFLPVHIVGFSQSPSSSIREVFKAHLIEEMQIYDELLEYGRFKGWIVDPPAYRI